MNSERAWTRAQRATRASDMNPPFIRGYCFLVTKRYRHNDRHNDQQKKTGRQKALQGDGQTDRQTARQWDNLKLHSSILFLGNNASNCSLQRDYTLQSVLVALILQECATMSLETHTDAYTDRHRGGHTNRKTHWHSDRQTDDRWTTEVHTDG